MGFLKLLAITTAWLLTIGAFSVEKKSAGSGCVDLLCPDTALHYGLRNLINDDTLKTDACTSCDQCTQNGYSVCLRLRDSRASRTAGGCSCAHQLAANCHNDLTQKVHPANLTMHLYSACYTDALQKPPQPLAVNDNSSILVTIEPFWLEPYWRHLKVENIKLHYEYLVKAPEHCEGEVETTPHGIHTCTNSVAVDLSKDDVAEGKTNDDDDYEHSDNYDQYDDELPPEVQFDRDVFAGAKQMETYYTATVRRPRQLKIGGSKQDQIHDADSEIESEHLKFDMKPELYGIGEDDVKGDSEEVNEEVVATTTHSSAAASSSTKAVTSPEVINVTEMEMDKDESAQSEELGGTNFFEEDAKNAEKEEEDDATEKSDDDPVVNLQDIEPTKLKSQEDAKKKEEEGESDKKSDSEEKEAESELALTNTNNGTVSKEETEESEESITPESESDAEVEADKEAEEEKDVDEKSGEKDEGTSEDSESESTTTSSVELVEGEGGSDEEDNEADKDKEANFFTRFTDSFDFPRVRLVFLITLAAFILFILLVLCCFYREKYCCGKKKESKNSNGYRYTNANAQSTELKPVSRANSSGVAAEEHRLIDDGTDTLDNFRSVVRSGTTFNPNKVEMGISVGMGKFGPIYRAMFNSYNGSIHDVNIYLLKNVTRLPDDQLNNLTGLLKSNVAAGAHPNIVSLCGITQAGPDVMLMWEPLHQPTLQGVLRESRCARFGSEPFNFASFLSSERLATMAIGCCTGLEHLLKKNVYPTHISTSNVLVAERGIVKIGGFGLAEHHALNMSSENAPTRLRWMPPEYFKRDSKMVLNEQTMIWPLGVVLWEIFSLGGTPFSTQRQVQSFIDSMRDGSAKLEDITYCGEAVTQLLSTCTSHTAEARGDLKTIIRRLECISADAKAQINLCYRDDFPYLPIVTQLEQQME